MMWPLQRHLILCVWRGENKTECSRERARKLTRNIPSKNDRKSAAFGDALVCKLEIQHLTALDYLSLTNTLY